MNTIPSFSIIIPTYNRSGQISNAINSVLNQTFISFEVIIVDDGSTDNTKDVINTFEDSRLIYLYQQNKGVSQARNQGALIAKGKYLIFLDTDDLLTHRYLESLNFELSKGEYKIGFGYAKYLDPTGKQIAFVKPEKSKDSCGPQLAGAFAISKILFESSKGYDANLSYSENTEFFLRLRLEDKLNENSICLIKDEGIVVNFRDSRERFHAYSALKYKSTGYFLEKHKTYFAKSVDLFVIYKAMYAINAFQSGEIKKAKRAILDVIIKKPFRIKPYFQYLLFNFPFFAKMYWKKSKD